MHREEMRQSHMWCQHAEADNESPPPLQTSSSADAVRSSPGFTSPTQPNVPRTFPALTLPSKPTARAHLVLLQLPATPGIRGEVWGSFGVRV